MSGLRRDGISPRLKTAFLGICMVAAGCSIWVAALGDAETCAEAQMLHPAATMQMPKNAVFSLGLIPSLRSPLM